MDSSRLIEPILYSDMFDSPLTREEIWQFAPVKCTIEQVKTAFATNPLFKEKIVERDGCYYFRGRDDLIDIRKKCLKRSKTLWKKARFVAGLIQYMPFVRAIAVTGSLAMNNVRGSDDIDYIIFTEEKRLWMVFAVLGTIGRLTKRRLLCPNYYISIGHYHLQRKDFYTAREITQAKPLMGLSCYKDFLRLNNWVTDYLPNFNHNTDRARELPQRTLPKTIKTVIERLLSGPAGDKLEEILKTTLKSRLHVHHKTFDSKLDQETLTSALNEIELRFHGMGHRESILAEFQRRVKEHQCGQSA